MNRTLNKLLLAAVDVDAIKKIIADYPGRVYRLESIIHEYEIQLTEQGVDDGLKLKELAAKGMSSKKTASRRKNTYLRNKPKRKKP
jgi:hypothetical protein